MGSAHSSQRQGDASESPARLPKPERTLSLRDPLLAELIQRRHDRWPDTPNEEPIWGLVRMVIAQQVSTLTACRIAQRVRAVYPTVAEHVPSGIPDVASLRGLGLPESRARCCIEILTRGSELRDAVAQGRRWEEVVSEIKGVGPWTISVFRIIVLRNPDVLPVGDIGLVRAATNLYGGPVNLERLGERWRPYRSVACWYLWGSLGNEQLG
jgi:DNA-3-methyladenine glycosylase II